VSSDTDPAQNVGTTTIDALIDRPPPPPVDATNDNSDENRDEEILLEIDAEHMLALDRFNDLELEEQKAHDIQEGQLQDDIRHHLDSQIDEILYEIDRREPSDSDDENHPSYHTPIVPPEDISDLQADGT
jgi:hypothetical protein